MTPSLLRLAFGLSALALLAGAAEAQPIVTDPLVVTPGRMAEPLATAPGSVSVITAADIERRQYRTLPEALHSVPGLRVVQTGPRGSLASVFMRGTASNQVLVLRDGQRINDPSTPTGAFNFAHVALENVERIEVVRGPAGALYGSDAIGGVINIITRRGDGRPRLRGAFEVGSHDTIHARAGVGGAHRGIGFDASLSALDTGGDTVTPRRYRAGVPKEDDGHRNVSGALRLDAPLGERLDLALVGDVIDTRTELDVTPEDPDSRERTRQYHASAALTGRFYDGRLRPRVSLAFTRHERRDRNDADPFSVQETRLDSDGERFAFGLQTDIDVDEANTATFGVEAFRESFRSRGTDDFGGGFAIMHDSRAAAWTRAAFAQHRIAVADRVFVTSGVRLDVPQAFDPTVTFHVSPTYLHVETGTRLHASVGTGFKTPSLHERFGFNVTSFGTTFIGNPDLDPERSLSWEVGASQVLWQDRARIGATWFWTRVDDAVITVFDAAFNATTVNNVDTATSGVEAFAELRPLESISARLDYTWLRAKNRETGARLPRRPRHKLSFLVHWAPTAWASLSGGVDYFAGVRDIGLFGGDVSLANYAVARLAASAAIADGLLLTGRIENLLDRAYETADGFKAPRREFLIGLAARF